MEEQLVSLKTARLAKEKGFDADCMVAYTPLKDWMVGKADYDKLDNGMYLRMQGNPFGSYNNPRTWVVNNSKLTDAVAAPTQSLLQKWLREAHKKHVQVSITRFGEWFQESVTLSNNGSADSFRGISTKYNTYEEALEAGLQHALQTI